MWKWCAPTVTIMHMTRIQYSKAQIKVLLLKVMYNEKMAVVGYYSGTLLINPLSSWHGYRLIICLYLAETEIRWRKDDSQIKKQTNLNRQSILITYNIHLADVPCLLLHVHYL